MLEKHKDKKPDCNHRKLDLIFGMIPKGPREEAKAIMYARKKTVTKSIITVTDRPEGCNEDFKASQRQPPTRSEIAM
jgi:hypothetical protein